MDLNYSVLVIQPWLNYRGAETLAYQFAEDLRNRGVDAGFLCLFVKPSMQEQVDHTLLLLPSKLLQRVLQFPVVFLFLGFGSLLITTLIYSRKYFFLNPHNFPSVWCAAIAKFFYPVKIVWTVHNFPQHPFRGVMGTIYDWLTNPLDKFLVKHVDTIICVSEKVAGQVRERYGREAGVIYPGIDVDFFSHSGDLQNNSFGRFILQVGQIRKEKCQEVTLSVFKKLRERDSSLQLLFIGEGDRKNLQLDKEVKDYVFFLPSMPKRELAKYYHDAQMLLYPSAWGEGCTLVPIEAIASGCRRIAVVSGCGVDELINNKKIPGVVWKTDSDNLEAILYKQLTSDAIIDWDRSFLSRRRYCEEYLSLFNLFLGSQK